MFSFEDKPQENSAPPPPPVAVEIPSDVAAAGAAILSQQPDVQEHAVASAENNPPPPPAAAPGTSNEPQKFDDHGTPFDPKIHSGSKLANGHWRVKKSAKGSVVAGANVSATEAAKKAADENMSRAAGAACASAIINTCQMILGDEWAPRKDPFDEMDVMQRAFGDYFVAKNVKDFPPGVALTMVLGSYAMARMQMPQTKERAGKIKTWFVLRAARWKVRKELKKLGVQAEVEIRDGALFVDGVPYEQIKKRGK